MHLRRLSIAAAVMAVAAVAGGIAFGRIAMALFGVLGLALGLLNMVLVQRSALKFSVSEDPKRKRKGAGNVLGRLAIVTGFAMIIAVVYRPEGFGVFFGLVAFQFVMIVTTLVPLLKEMRQQEGMQA